MNIISGILIVFVVIAVIGWAVYAVNALFGGEDFKSDEDVIKKVAEIILGQKKEKGILYDLGSAHGNFALRISKLYPDLKVYGFDSSKVRIFFSRLRSFFYFHYPKFICADFFRTDVSHTDIIYLYLSQNLMFKLEEKLKKELKPGAIVITNKVSFPNWSASKIYEINSGKIYLYAKE